jgi:hypothetical protein
LCRCRSKGLCSRLPCLSLFSSVDRETDGDEEEISPEEAELEDVGTGKKQSTEESPVDNQTPEASVQVVAGKEQKHRKKQLDSGLGYVA